MLLQHDANFFVKDEPTRHEGARSSSHHHQTADAVTFLPRPAAAAAAAAAAAPFSVDSGDSSSDAEEVVVSCDGRLNVYRLQQGQVRSPLTDMQGTAD
jgi:ApbE superfamily uncharacterized protein (UPF0280 family)